MPVDPVKPRSKLTAGLVNRVIRQANKADRLDAAGMLTSAGPGGLRVGPRPSGAVFQEPAATCVIVNRDPQNRDIPALGVAAILTDSDAHPAATGTGDGWLDDLVFNVEHGAESTGTELVVAAERIPHGGAGLAYCAGVCHVVIDDDTRATVVAAGSPRILWEETDAAGDVITGRAHKAIVRFGGGGSRPWRRFKIGGDNAAFNKAVGIYTGIPWNADDLDEVAAAYDPAAPVAITDDGIGYGVSDIGENVLIVTRQVVVDNVVIGGGMLDFDWYNDNWLMCYRQISIPVAGTDETVSAWEAYWA